MKNRHVISLRVCNNISRNLTWLCIAYPVFQLLSIPIFHLLCKFFPLLKASESVLYIPVYAFIMLFFLQGLFLFYSVTLSQDRIIVSWLGLPLRTVPTGNLRFLCAVGNESADRLCLACKVPEELAPLEESALLKGLLTKHDVPFLKQNPDSINILARKYLLRLRKKSFLQIRKQDVIFLPMDPILLEQVRRLYPNLPYKNYTDCQKTYVTPSWSVHKVPCYAMIYQYYTSEITEDSVIYTELKKVVGTFPLFSVKTIARVDMFRDADRYNPHYIPVLLLSTFSIDEMAEQSSLSGRTTEIRAYDFAYRQVKAWRIQAIDCCNLYYTENALETLRELCPNADYLDISHSWVKDSP